MAQVDQDDTFYANNPRRLSFTVTDAGNADVAFDLTGFTAKWSMSKLKANGDFSKTPLLQKSVDEGSVVITGAAEGELYVDIDETDTANLLGDFHHQLEVFNGSNEGVVVATGKLTILKNILETIT